MILLTRSSERIFNPVRYTGFDDLWCLYAVTENETDIFWIF